MAFSPARIMFGLVIIALVPAVSDAPGAVGVGAVGWCTHQLWSPCNSRRRQRCP